jgi:hypothetical protein
MNLYVLRAALDFLVRLDNFSMDINNGFLGYPSCELNHALADVLTHKQDSLDSSKLFPDDNKKILAKRSVSMESASDPDLLVHKGLVDVLDWGVLPGVPVISIRLRPVEFKLSKSASAGVIRIFCVL